MKRDNLPEEHKESIQTREPQNDAYQTPYFQAQTDENIIQFFEEEQSVEYEEEAEYQQPEFKSQMLDILRKLPEKVYEKVKHVCGKLQPLYQSHPKALRPDPCLLSQQLQKKRASEIQDDDMELMIMNDFTNIDLIDESDSKICTLAAFMMKVNIERKRAESGKKPPTSSNETDMFALLKNLPLKSSTFRDEASKLRVQNESKRHDNLRIQQQKDFKAFKQYTYEDDFAREEYEVASEFVKVFSNFEKDSSDKAASADKEPLKNEAPIDNKQSKAICGLSKRLTPMSQRTYAPREFH
ncbi:hypothetical protein FGO68_gene1180 [Halteria grandinella]|uniref:Uncharacterized protein n=1 Tax=Halteria grandinella TaxID=5974 RepID=A0A8J8NPB3_HALGN|nr:hypothetical protein FGO68_gene1180 [Halteria grandinella]